MLMHIRASDTASVVRLRSSLGWSLPKFSSAMFGLIERGFLTRDFSDRLRISISGLEYIVSSVNNGREAASRYQEETRAPQLPVNALYLPDHKHFQIAMKRSVYTK